VAFTVFRGQQRSATGDSSATMVCSPGPGDSLGMASIASCAAVHGVHSSRFTYKIVSPKIATESALGSWLFSTTPLPVRQHGSAA